MRKPVLVRDKVPELIVREKKMPKVRVANEKEYWPYLRAKLIEETSEFIESPSEEEYADIMEVLFAIAEYRGWKKSDLENIRKKKAEFRGTFSKMLILEGIE